jgi:hypothetical protein
MGFCANCGTPRNGNVRFCGSCGTEFDDSPAAPGEQATQASGWTAPADATRTDMSPRDTLIDPPGAKAGQPDPFASWYSSAQPAAAPEPPRGRPDTYWQQPTETVRPAQQGPGGYPAPPPAGYGAPPAPGGYPTAPVPMYGAPYPPGPAGGPPQRGGGGRRGLLVVLAVIVVLAAGGGAYALATRLGKHSTAGPSSPPASTPAASSPSGATKPATGTGSPRASASASASSSGSSSSPAANLVAVGRGVSGPVPAVQQLLNKRFDGINTHNYAEYASTLTTREQANQPQSKFDSGYRSTTDSGITLTALSQTSGGLTATVAFTSHQNPSDSGDGSACNTWTTNYYLVASGTGYLIDVTPAGSPPPSRGDC